MRDIELPASSQGTSNRGAFSRGSSIARLPCPMIQLQWRQHRCDDISAVRLSLYASSMSSGLRDSSVASISRRHSSDRLSTHPLDEIACQESWPARGGGRGVHVLFIMASCAALTPYRMTRPAFWVRRRMPETNRPHPHTTPPPRGRGLVIVRRTYRRRRTEPSVALSRNQRHPPRFLNEAIDVQTGAGNFFNGATPNQDMILRMQMRDC